MWGAISALLTRAAEALGIETPEIPGVTDISDAMSAATGGIADQAGALGADVTGTAADLAANAAEAGDTVTGVVDQATAAAAALPDLAQVKPN